MEWKKSRSGWMWEAEDLISSVERGGLSSLCQVAFQNPGVSRFA